MQYAIQHKIEVLPIHLEETELSIDFEFNLSNIQAIFKYKISEEDYKHKILKFLSERFDKNND